MSERIVLLHALIMTAPDNFSIAYQHGADRNSPLGQTGTCLIEGGLHEFIHKILFITAPEPGLMISACLVQIPFNDCDYPACPGSIEK
jgi:hypothetical protein